jgi:hypothetical protein
MPAQVVVDDLSRPRDTYRLIIASNRGPVEYQLGQDKKLKSRRGLRWYDYCSHSCSRSYVDDMGGHGND